MRHDLTRGSIAKNLLRFSFPIMLGMLLQTAYNIVDTIYIGMLGAMELAAVSLTFPVVFVFIAFASGLGVGANALVSQAIGRKHIHEANNFAEHALFIGLLLGAAIAFFGIIFSPPIFTFMGASSEVLPLTIQYSTPIFFGVIFMFAWFISDSILRAQGNSKTPMKSLAVSVALNAVLDPILIFGLFGFPALGLSGAAIATVVSRIIAAMLNFYYIYTPKSVISLSLREFRPYPSCVKSMLVVGLPASLTQGLTAIGFIAITALVGAFGSFAIAAFGIGLRLNSVAILPMIGISSGVSTFVGQNIGAKNFERAKQVSLFATKITFLMGLAFASSMIFFPEHYMRVFTQDPNIIAIGKQYLSIVPLAYIFYGLYFAITGAFQGAGKTQLAFAANLAFWVVAIVLAYILSQSIELLGIWIAMVAAAAIEFVVVAAIFWSNVWMKPSKAASFKSCEPGA